MTDDYMRTIEDLVDRYTPEIETLFGTEMPHIKVISFREYAQYLLKREKDKGEEFNWRRESQFVDSVLYLLSGTAFKYCGETDSICVSNYLIEKPRTIQSWSINRACNRDNKKVWVVHEMGHGLLGRVFDTEEILDKNVKKCIEEGFADYLALDNLEIYGKDSSVIEYVRAFREKRRTVTLWDHISKKFVIPYKRGYNFFSQAINHIGRPNLSLILDNPPDNMKEIKNPQLYLKRFA